MDAALYRVGKGRRISARRVDERGARAAARGPGQRRGVGARAAGHARDRGRARRRQGDRGRREARPRSSRQGGHAGRPAHDAGDDERAAYRRSIAAHEAERKGWSTSSTRCARQARQHRKPRRSRERRAPAAARAVRRCRPRPLKRRTWKRQRPHWAALSKKSCSARAETARSTTGSAPRRPDTGVKLATLRGAEATPVRWITEARIVAKRNGTSG
jgi:hypothetical protein